MNIDQLIEQYKTYDELKVYCEAQFKQILALSKKNKDLEQQVSDLKKGIVSNSVVQNKPVVKIETSILVKDDAKTIAEIQLSRLKEVSLERQLTMEETKQLDIFNKVVNYQDPDGKKKDIPVTAKNLDADALMRLVEDSSGTEQAK